MPKPTRAEMQRMAKENKPRQATIRPIAPVVEEQSSVQLRIPPNSNGAATNQPLPQTAQRQAKKEPVKIELGFDLQAALARVVDELRGGVVVPVVGFVAGVAIGWILLGHILFPVEIKDVNFDLLAGGHQYAVVYAAADLMAYDPNSPKVLRLSNQWPELDDIACELLAVEADQSAQMRLQSLAYRLNGVGCPLGNN